jgi:hypothetical protein
MRFSFYSFFQIFDNLKPMIMLLCVTAISVTEKKTDSFLHMFELVNAPSVAVGIINAVMYNYLHIGRLIDTGTLKRYGDVFLLRAGGFIGHSGPFSETCAVLFIVALFREKSGIKKWIKMAFFALGLYCGRGRFPLGVAVAAVFWYLWTKIAAKNRKYLIFAAIFIAILAAYPTFVYVLELFLPDLESQIRFHGFRTVLVLITSVLFFGVGIGTIGNEGSMAANYDLYSSLGIVRYGGKDWESQLAKSLLQTGVIGTVMWYTPFVKSLHKIYIGGGQGRYRNLTFFLLIYYIANSFINKSYTLPFLLLLCVLISAQYYEDNATSERGMAES